MYESLLNINFQLCTFPFCVNRNFRTKIYQQNDDEINNKKS